MAFKRSRIRFFEPPVASSHYHSLTAFSPLSSSVLRPAAVHLPAGDPGWRPGLYLLPAGNPTWADKIIFKKSFQIYFTMHPGICILGHKCGIKEEQLADTGGVDIDVK